MPTGFSEMAEPAKSMMSKNTKDRIRYIKEGGTAANEIKLIIPFDQLPYELGGEKGKDELAPKNIKKQPWDKSFWGRK